jgi:Tfp pilus assembly protein PilP
VLLLLGAVSLPPAAHCGDREAAKGASGQKDGFVYASLGKRDPFEPVYLSRQLRQKATPADDKIGYEMEELKVVGVITSGGVRFAMMEDAQGKGQLFKQGDFLNKNLWVFDVLEDKVIMAYRLRGDIRKIPMDIPRK